MDLHGSQNGYYNYTLSTTAKDDFGTLNGDLVRARRVFKSGKYSYEMNPEDLVNEYYNDMYLDIRE